MANWNCWFAYAVSGNGRLILAHSGRRGTPRFPPASRVSCSERLCENPEFANRVPTSTPRAWAAHAARPHFLLPSIPFLGLAPDRPEFSHSLAICSAAGGSSAGRLENHVGNRLDNLFENGHGMTLLIGKCDEC